MKNKELITIDSMFDQIILVHPSIAELSQGTVDWYEDPSYQPTYHFLSDLVRLCTKLYDQKKLGILRRVFAELENWLLKGSDEVKTAASVGFIEDMQIQIFIKIQQLPRKISKKCWAKKLNTDG